MLLKESKYLSLIFILTISLLSILFFSNQSLAQNQNNEFDVVGFAWSDNIGWVSFSSHGENGSGEYGVKLNDSTGQFSGFAWSDNIGWISFEPGGTPPDSGTSGTSYDESTGDVSGWARACSVFDTGCDGNLKSNSKRGGWDGWISFQGSNYGVSIDEDDNFDGYAWGDEVVGWLDTSGVSVIDDGPPEVELSADNTIAAYGGESIELTWTVDNASSCQASGGSDQWSGQLSATGGSKDVTLNTGEVNTNNMLRTYTIECENPDNLIENGQNASDEVDVDTIHLNGSPSTVDANSDSNLHWWTSTNVLSCDGTVESGPAQWPNSNDLTLDPGAHDYLNGSEQNITIPDTTEFSMTCQNDKNDQAIAYTTISIPEPRFFWNPSNIQVEFDENESQIQVDSNLISENSYSDSNINLSAGQGSNIPSGAIDSLSLSQNSVGLSENDSQNIVLTINFDDAGELNTDTRYPVWIEATDSNNDQEHFIVDLYRIEGEDIRPRFEEI